MSEPLDRKGECQGNKDKCNVDGCPKFGTLGKPNYKDGKRRIKGCGDPVARGKRNRSKGDSKARKARKKLGIVASGGVNSRHEEHWGGALRIEVKSGAQIQPIATRFLAAEAQSNAAKSMGDIRPFVMIAMPDEMSDGIVLIRLEEFAQMWAIFSENQQ